MGAATAIGVGGTTAFFSDAETSTGNTFAAGAIDLKIDNESYYNGAVSTSTSWTLSDLKDGQLFFNFRDIKPDDEGEDTISVHVQNDAWACMDVTLTSNDDNSSTEPELATPDTQDDPNNTWDGELAQNLQMFWWADDGDNVYENGELSISSSSTTPNGVRTLLNLASTTGAFSVALADASHNAWGNNGPLPANQTVYLAKAWCFGTLTPLALPQDGIGHTASSTNGPLVRGTGINCNGTALNNLTQTDGATLDVAFRAIQSRNNPAFLCGNNEPRQAKLTVIKQIVNDNGGNNVVPDFHLVVIGDTTVGVTSGIQTTILSGAYDVSETGVSGYVASFSGDCNAEGHIVLNPGDVKTCTITNDDLPANITLIKNVINNNGGSLGPTNFKMRVDGTLVPNTSSKSVTSNANHFITEDAVAGYHFVSITGAGCPASTSTAVVLNEGQAITCTITNDDN